MGAAIKDNIKERFKNIKKITSLFRLTPKLNDNDERLDISLYDSDGKLLEKQDYSGVCFENDWHTGYTIDDMMSIGQSQQIRDNEIVEDHISLEKHYGLGKHRYHGFCLKSYNGRVVGLHACLEEMEYKSFLNIKKSIEPGSEKIEEITAEVRYYPNGYHEFCTGDTPDKWRYIKYKDDGLNKPTLTVFGHINYNLSEEEKKKKHKKDLDETVEIKNSDEAKSFSREIQKTLASIENAIDIATPGAKKLIKELMPMYNNLAHKRFSLLRRGSIKSAEYIHFHSPGRYKLKQKIWVPDFLKKSKNRKAG